MSMKIVWGDTRLKAPDDAYVRCRSCRKTVIGKIGDEYCPRCNYDNITLQQWIEQVMGWCVQCAEPIKNTRRRKFCSQPCANRYQVEDAMAMTEAARKALDLGRATGWLHKLFGYLADRDGPKCYLCDKRIKLEMKGAMGPSVDHLVPRSKGGTHDLSNLALVHKRCNSVKGNRPANEQLRLLG